jgi:tripartite-type tricarboxylate transporter receptor subunit TctC
MTGGRRKGEKGDVGTAAIRKVVETDDHKKRLRDLGVSPHYLNAGEYAAFWANYESRVGPLLKELRASQAK